MGSGRVGAREACGLKDLSYRSLFSFPRMVEDLIREFVPESWVDKLDFSTLEAFPGLTPRATC
jgi:hypothetical protein